jgi:hypothetical protein
MRTDSPEIITIYGSGPVDHQPIFGFQPSATRQGNSSGAASPTLTAAGSHTHTSGGLQEARSDCSISGLKWDSYYGIDKLEQGVRPPPPARRYGHRPACPAFGGYSGHKRSRHGFWTQARAGQKLLTLVSGCIGDSRLLGSSLEVQDVTEVQDVRDLSSQR